MQLIQIGVTKQKTIMDLIQEMAANQFSEIEQLKAAARSSIHHNSDREPCAFWSGLRQTQGSPAVSVPALLLHTSDKCCSIAREVLPMSYRNGDKSREHRLRKARQKMRLKTRGLQVKDDAKAPSAAASGPKK